MFRWLFINWLTYTCSGARSAFVFTLRDRFSSNSVVVADTNWSECVRMKRWPLMPSAIPR